MTTSVAARARSVLGGGWKPASGSATADAAVALAVLIAAVVVPIGLEQVLPFDRYVGLATVVAIFVGTFLWRPTTGVVVFALYMLFIDTLLRYASGIGQADEVTVPLLFAITIVRRRAVIRDRISWPREGAVAALVVLAVASSLVHRVPLEIWTPGLLLLGKGIGFLYVVALLDVSEHDLAVWKRAVLAVGSFVLVMGLVELVDPAALTAIGLSPTAQARGDLPSIKSVFFHPALLAWFAAFVGLYLYAHYAFVRRRWMLVMAILFSLATVLAARRRALISLSVGVAAGLGWSLARRPIDWRAATRAWGPGIASLVLLLALFLPGISSLYTTTIDRYVPTPSGSPAASPTASHRPQTPDELDAAETPARLALYKGSVEVARDTFPLGAGLGRYGSWMSRVNYSPLYHRYGLDKIHGLKPSNPKFVTDTFWPQILGELGVFGVVAYVALLAVVGLALWRASRLPGWSPSTTAMLVGTGLVFGQAIVESLASPMFHSAPREYLLWGAVGGALALVASHPPAPPAVAAPVTPPSTMAPPADG